MKRLLAFLLILPMMFTSCGSYSAKTTPAPGMDASSGKDTHILEPQTEIISGTVAALYETSFLLASDGRQGDSLYTVSYCDTEVERGNKVDITYSGYVLTVYPGILQDESKVEVTKEGNDLLGLYLEVLDYLYETDPGLNGSIDYVSFDFDNIANLTEAEKRALGYIFSNKIQKQDLYMNVQELEEEGLVKDLYFENGIVLSISTDDTDGEDGFTFSAVKWRSGLGAIGISDCTATLSGREWSYEPGGFWIS